MDVLEEKKKAVATFRFGVISDFVCGSLGYGDKERLLKEKSGRSYEIPFSTKRQIGRATILAWVQMYQKAGNRIDGLYPKSRRDRGTFRTLDPEVRMAIRQVLSEDADLTVPNLIHRLRQSGHVPAHWHLNPATIYRFIEKADLRVVSSEKEDKRKFEAEAPNDLWQADVMHGPKAYIEGKLRKTYLIALIDDHSRMVTHACFYHSESIRCFQEALRQAILRWGLPQKLYTDNGACFRSSHLEFITAALGVGLRHARPYKPQGKGKIERFFRTVRQDFLPKVTKSLKIEVLNEHLLEWVEEFNTRSHGGTNQKPIERYRAGIECVRPAPPDLLTYFREVERRLVRHDRTVALRGNLFEVPTMLIDKRVELRFDKDDLENIEVFFDGRSYGRAVRVDQKINAKGGRDWQKARPEVKTEILRKEPEWGGRLFGSNKEEIP